MATRHQRAAVEDSSPTAPRPRGIRSGDPAELKLAEQVESVKALADSVVEADARRAASNAREVKARGRWQYDVNALQLEDPSSTVPKLRRLPGTYFRAPGTYF